MQIRQGETDKQWFRCERFLHTSVGWYFTTRDATQEGPFYDQQQAATELDYYIRTQSMWKSIAKADSTRH